MDKGHLNQPFTTPSGHFNGRSRLHTSIIHHTIDIIANRLRPTNYVMVITEPASRLYSGSAADTSLQAYYRNGGGGKSSDDDPWLWHLRRELLPLCVQNLRCSGEIFQDQPRRNNTETQKSLRVKARPIPPYPPIDYPVHPLPCYHPPPLLSDTLHTFNTPRHKTSTPPLKRNRPTAWKKLLGSADRGKSNAATTDLTTRNRGQNVGKKAVTHFFREEKRHLSSPHTPC